MANFAKGGIIKGYDNSDRVPAILSRDCYIIKPEVVKLFGAKYLTEINELKRTLSLEYLWDVRD